MLLGDGTILTGTSPEFLNSSTDLCHEAEPYCAAFRLDQPIVASVCLHRTKEDHFIVLSPLWSRSRASRWARARRPGRSCRPGRRHTGALDHVAKGAPAPLADGAARRGSGVDLLSRSLRPRLQLRPREALAFGTT